MSWFLSSPNPVTKMKNAFYLLSLAGLFSLGACEFKDSVNTDPNNPRDISSPVTLLTSSQVGFAYTYGGAYGRYTSLFTNQVSGIDRQPISIDNFNFLTSETDDAWDNSYRTLLNLDAIIAKSQGSPHYTGVAKIMKALVLGTLAENFGAVPYRNAVQGKEDGSGLQPTYDSGPQNYEDIQALLNQGIAEVQATESILSPGGNDDMFGGSLDSWSKFAYALKARYYLHTAKANPANLDSALQASRTAQGITAKLTFAGKSVGSQGPFYQYQTQRGDLGSGRLLTDTLNTYDDPRAYVYVDSPGDNGSNPGQADGLNGPAGEEYYVSPLVQEEETVYFVNSAEPYFIEAEILFKKGDAAGAAASHNKAVIASLKERVGSDTVLVAEDSPSDSASKLRLAAYYAAHTREDASSISLNKIMVQKWLALYLNQEAFADWRRTGIPQTKLPLDNITGGAFVRKFPYPQKERTLNGANLPTNEPNPPQIGRVWWDLP